MPGVLTEVRAGRLLLGMLAGFLVILLALVRMQVWQGEYYRALSEKNRIRVMYLEAPRGKILDRGGRELASSRLSFNCSVMPAEAKKTIDRSLQIIAPVLGEEVQTLAERYRKKKPGVFRTVLLAEDIDPSRAAAIEERLDSLPGVWVETRPQRQYPYADAAAHLTGYTGPLNPAEEESAETYGYESSDWLGKEGIEKIYESYLRGRSGGIQMEVDSRGRMIKTLGVKEPKEGMDVQLTVDARLQQFVDGLLKDQKGAVVVMELKEGGILAMSSAPSFDPNLFSSTAGRKEVGPYLHDERSPMMNRAIRGQYPPGSIFKIVTALAALENHRSRPGRVFSCPGYLFVGRSRFKCWSEKGHGPQNFTEAFAHSCDVYFYSTGLAAGPDAIYKEALDLGLALATGIDLPEERKGLVPSREWKQKTKHAAWYDGDTANLAIGQGYLQLTPIQALLMVSAIATDGQLLAPHLVDRINGIKVAERHAKTLHIPTEYLQVVKKGLEAVVQSDTGTGRLARVPGLNVAGKTGTAETGQENTHAWFVGYAPAENPKAAIVVFIEHGGHGGVVAAGLAGKVLAWLHENSYLGT